MNQANGTVRHSGLDCPSHPLWRAGRGCPWHKTNICLGCTWLTNCLTGQLPGQHRADRLAGWRVRFRDRLCAGWDPLQREPRGTQWTPAILRPTSLAWDSAFGFSIATPESWGIWGHDVGGSTDKWTPEPLGKVETASEFRNSALGLLHFETRGPHEKSSTEVSPRGDGRERRQGPCMTATVWLPQAATAATRAVQVLISQGCSLRAWGIDYLFDFYHVLVFHHSLFKFTLFSFFCDLAASAVACQQVPALSTNSRAFWSSCRGGGGGGGHPHRC